MTVHFHKTASDEDRYNRYKEYRPIRTGTSIRNDTLSLNGFYRARGKALLDYLFVLLALPVVLPVIGIVALMVALTGGSPFYTQRRLGRNGVVFHMLKIRSMVPEADEVLAAYLASNPEARHEWNNKQKLCNDPRVTRLGRILRKTSLDELPQLWNVLRGDMSLVGPRPITVDQKALYPGQAYYEMRPGITGNWQVSDRNESSFVERATFDEAYYRGTSLKTDIALLYQTIWVVIHGTGY